MATAVFTPAAANATGAPIAVFAKRVLNTIAVSRARSAEQALRRRGHVSAPLSRADLLPFKL